jgi:hypothetical protein
LSSVKAYWLSSLLFKNDMPGLDMNGGSLSFLANQLVCLSACFG